MPLKYLHVMVRVDDLDKSKAFYELLGLKETRRYDSEKGRFTLLYLAPPGQEEAELELTHNWDGDDQLPADSRHFGHLCYGVDDIYETCQHLQDNDCQNSDQEKRRDDPTCQIESVKNTSEPARCRHCLGPVCE